MTDEKFNPTTKLLKIFIVRKFIYAKINQAAVGNCESIDTTKSGSEAQ